VSSIGVDDVASVSTAIGVGIAAYQLWQTRLAFRDGFERTFVDRYREIANELPVDILLGVSDAGSDPAHRMTFFRYFELCEEELYYRAHGKISKSTWRDWWYGICTNLSTAPFQSAYREIVESSAGGAMQRFLYLQRAERHLHDAAYAPRPIKSVAGPHSSHEATSSP
jgi:hypothetical protein